jgi:hypothetical protein
MARFDLPDGRSARVLSWDEVSEVLSRFDQLDPFDDGKPFWTMDREQWGQPLWAVVWGSKRHALVASHTACRVASSTEHVLGAYAPPPSVSGRRADGRHLWTESVAELHARLAYEGTTSGIVPPFAWEPHDASFPAFKRLSISGPEALAQLPPDLGLHPFARVVEVEASQIYGPASRPRLVTPDPGGDLSDWQRFPWHDAHTSQAAWLSTDPSDVGATIVETLRAKAIAWVRPRDVERPPGVIVDPLLVRGVGRAGGAFNDGSPQLVMSEVDVEGVLVHAMSVLGSPTVAELTGIPDSTLRYFRTRRPRRKTVRRAVRALELRLGPDALSHLVDSLDLVRECALPGCDEPSRPRSRTCSERHKKALSRLSEVLDA